MAERLDMISTLAGTNASVLEAAWQVAQKLTPVGGIVIALKPAALFLSVLLAANVWATVPRLFSSSKLKLEPTPGSRKDRQDSQRRQARRGSNTNALPLVNHTRAPINGDVFTLTRAEASHFAGLALKCVAREYPNKLDHTMSDASEVQSPRALHPAFYGCLDWHSSVHGHWMLVRLLRLFPDLPETTQIRNALNENLTATNIQTEVAYLTRANRQSFERTYGWAWLLKLAEELRAWNDPDARIWSNKLRPLADALIERYKKFLPRQTYPIRTGVHPNTAFGLAFALDYARLAGDLELEALIVERSKTYFLADAAYPIAWEPGGEDFLSPGLMEADLMLRVLEPLEFQRWFHRFLPGLATRRPQSLLAPATVADRSDPKIVHLDGLNLSRAWCMRHIASALPARDAAHGVLARAAMAHAKDALAHVASGEYGGEHWLASFAVYMLTTPSVR